MQHHDKDQDKVSKDWQTFKWRILIHSAVGTAAMCKELLILKESAQCRKSNKHKFAIKCVNKLFYFNIL